jgi:hypothetical protein
MLGCVKMLVRNELTTSPVMATSTGTHKPVNNDTRAQTMAMPALGPSYTNPLVSFGSFYQITVPNHLLLRTSR